MADPRIETGNIQGESGDLYYKVRNSSKNVHNYINSTMGRCHMKKVPTAKDGTF